jgi:hypothetical protein
MRVTAFCASSACLKRVDQRRIEPNKLLSRGSFYSIFQRVQNPVLAFGCLTRSTYASGATADNCRVILASGLVKLPRAVLLVQMGRYEAARGWKRLPVTAITISRNVSMCMLNVVGKTL